MSNITSTTLNSTMPPMTMTTTTLKPMTMTTTIPKSNFWQDHKWWIIAGGGGIILLVAVVVLVVCIICCRRRRRRKLYRIKSGAEAEAIDDGTNVALLQLPQPQQEPRTMTQQQQTPGPGVHLLPNAVTAEGGAVPQQKQQAPPPPEHIVVDPAATTAVTRTRVSSRRPWQRNLMKTKQKQPPVRRLTKAQQQRRGQGQEGAVASTGREPRDDLADAEVPPLLLKQTFGAYQPLKGESMGQKFTIPPATLERNFPPATDSVRANLRDRKREILKDYKVLAEETKRRGLRPEFGTPSAQSTSTDFESSMVEDLE